MSARHKAKASRILEFWFDRGMAGFRIDVAPGLYKDAELRDNPPLEDGNPMEGAYGLPAARTRAAPKPDLLRTFFNVPSQI